MGITIEQLEKRIHLGWEKYPIPRPYICIKKETYTKLKALAVFIDSEFGEWEATPDGVMRGGMHPKRRQRDYSTIEVSKEEFELLYITKNLSVEELTSHFKTHRTKVLNKIKEFDLKKPVDLKLKVMTKTNQDRYGCDYVAQNSDINAKMVENRDIDKFKESYKETMLERYGVEHGFKVPEFVERAKQTMLEKYGSVHALKSEQCREKYKATIREKYGDETLEWAGNNIEEIRNKVVVTNKTKLGVEFPFQSDEIQEKVKQTCLARYGVTSITKVPAVKDKIRKSILARFGMHHLSLPEMRERIKQTSLAIYGCPCSLQNPDVARKSYETKIKNDSFNSSLAEKELRQFIQDLVSDVGYNDREIITPYELDIVIPHKNLAIEYNGLYHHSEAHKDKDYHAMKLARCNAAGYSLITIFEHEWYGRRQAVKSRLKAILNCNEHTLGARSTDFSVALKDEALNFLNEFHVQGGVRFDQAFKLTYDGMLVAVMTFARHHRQTSKELILNRFCVREGYSIIGGAAKLLKNANIKEAIVSYSDNRWSEGDIYQRLNFKLESQIKPDYFYFGKTGVHSKQSMKKTKEEASLGLSEHELRLAQGYLRVYDCGKKRWRLGN
jgi:very-short-patch-repair endonuclease